MPVGVGHVGLPGAGVDGVIGVGFHPPHRGVGARVVAPGACVDEGGGGGEVHD